MLLVDDPGFEDFVDLIEWADHVLGGDAPPFGGGVKVEPDQSRLSSQAGACGQHDQEAVCAFLSDILCDKRDVLCIQLHFDRGPIVVSGHVFGFHLTRILALEGSSGDRVVVLDFEVSVIELELNDRIREGSDIIQGCPCCIFFFINILLMLQIDTGIY